MIKSSHNRMIPYLLVFLMYLLIPAELPAGNVEMADQLRSSGKIYVVVGVLISICLGIFIFLWLLEKRISKIEKEVKKEK